MNSCYLCFNNQSGTTLINGPRGVHLCIADIICLHFGFEVSLFFFVMKNILIIV